MDAWKRKTRRAARVSELIHEEVSEMLARGEIKDPRIGFVTITAVKVSEDMQSCRIYVSVFGTEAQRQRALDGLASASGYVRGVLAKRLRMKRVPKLVFVSDESLREAQRVDEILDSLKTSGDLSDE